MPPTSVTSRAVNSDQTSRVCLVASRTKRRLANNDTLAPRVTTRKPQGTLIGKYDANGCTISDDLRRRLIDCSVGLVDIFRQAAPSKLSLKHVKEQNEITQIQSIPAKGTTNNAATRTESCEPNNLSSSARNSNVTRRTRSRQTKSVGQTQERLVERQRHTISSVSEDHHSIIHLDESSNIGTITETVDLSHKQTCTGNDVIVAASQPEPRRSTRRMSLKRTDCNQNAINSRTAPNRKTNNDMPPNGTGQQSVVEHSVDDIVPATVKESTKQSMDKLANDAFKTLIVSIKRIAPALLVEELKRIKYEDSTRDGRFSLCPSSSRANWRQKSSIKHERHTLVRPRANPKLVITSPIVEVPESPPPPPALEQSTLVNNSYLTAKMDCFKRPHPFKPAPMPLLVEEENEENDDVYAFLSSSQNSDASRTNKPKQQRQKPKQKKVPKAAAAKSANSKKRNVSTVKPKGKSQNVFGCNKYELSKVIKRLGGGPVQQPATVDYKINLDIPKTPPVGTLSPANVPQEQENVELPTDDRFASLETTQTLNPTLNRLKAGSLSFPFTSTPANKVSEVANNLNVPSMEQAASPWRLQDELIVPRTSYAHRTKEMLPSYESFAIDPVEAPGIVTERRKSSSGGTAIDHGLPPAASEPSEGMITDKELREMERMYVELKATSEMSERLIKAMRQSKQKAATPQQDQTMRQACLKLKQWYDRSMKAFNRSMRILGNVQHIPGCEIAANNRPTVAASCPSPLSHQQQRTLNDFNSSTDRFRSMLAQLQSTINDSDAENLPPPTPAPEKESASLGKSVPANKQVHILQDILILPDRSHAAKRNPLMPLTVVPLLPQRDSPLMSPLAKTPTNPGPSTNVTRRELRYDKEHETSRNENQPKDTDSVPPSTHSVVEINDDTAHHDTTKRTQNSRDYFGFDADDNSSASVVESSLAQVTLPMPLNISHETLERRLKGVKQLLPKRPIFRAQPKQPRSSGPTRFPLVPKLRVIGSPTKRPQTLHDFVASTPRAGGCSREKVTVAATDAPDVSAIEPISTATTELLRQQQVQEEQAERNDESDVVALFETPDRPAWLNNSAHQRTYSRIPKRRKKKNIYLANLGLDDDSEDDENDEPQVLSSDSETECNKKTQKQKRKAGRKKPVPVVETKDFKEFVESFNGMCEQVERYEMIIE